MSPPPLYTTSPSAAARISMPSAPPIPTPVGFLRLSPKPQTSGPVTGQRHFGGGPAAARAGRADGRAEGASLAPSDRPLAGLRERALTGAPGGRVSLMRWPG